MRLRRCIPVLFVALVATTSAVVTPASAKVERINGAVRCAVGNPLIAFSPGLRDKFHIEGRQFGRGPSTATLTATLSGCTDPSSAPAVAGIDHALLVGTGRVAGSYCDNLGNLKLKSTISWMTADDTLVGLTIVKLPFAITVLEPGDPWTVTFAGPAKPRSTVFPREAVSFVTSTGSNLGISLNCFKVSLESISLLDGTLTVDPAL